ncbi:MAG: FAD-binding protein [Bacteroidetes bacterium]|jgi:FAD/FMN-containing dehydrogenase|nr:FAD-binding protein [Bacteroidota bacterium]
MPIANPFDDAMLHHLRDRLRGAVLAPGDDGYDAARTVWNDRLASRPAVVARCTGAADVMAAVDLARANDLRLSVKGGGHDYAGQSAGEGGLMIDLSPMDGVRIDPRSKTAQVQAGATWGAFDHEAQAFGLAAPGPTVSTVGVAGSTLGGGTGYLARKHGLALDHLIGADVVTAEGDLVHASEDDHPELFWGLRGGSGNFGVVTAFEFRLHEVGPEVLAGQIVHPLEAAREGLQFYRAFMADAPDDLQVYAFFVRVPPIPAFPEEYHGKTALDFVVAYAGDLAEGEEILHPIREFGDPMLDGVRPQSYIALQQTFDEGVPKGHRWYSRAHFFDRLSDGTIDTVIDHVDPLPGGFTMVYFEPMGGAIRRVDPTATAFPHREASYGFQVLSGWTDSGEDDEIMEWTRAFHEAMTPDASGGVYVNLLSADEEDRIRSAYGANYDRLAALKNRWDPENLFQMNHNVPPAA